MLKINVARIKPYIEPIGLQTRNIILLQIPLTNFPPNNPNLFQQRLPHQAARPPPLDPLTLPPAPPRFQPPNFDPSLQIRDQPNLPDPPGFQPAPRVLPPINFRLPLRPMPRLLARNFPPLPEPALPARARPVAVPHLPPPPALPAWDAGQPKPPLFVPNFTLAPPAPAPPAPQPAAAGPQPLPETMRVTRSLQRHNNIPLLPPLTAVYKQFPFMFNESVASGPSLVSDAYGLPLVRPGCRVPTWIKRRRRYLKKLSPASNTLLTGDPFFAFDNTAYDAEWIPSLPQAPVVAPAAPVPPEPATLPPPAAADLPPVPPVVPPDQDRAPPLPPPHTPHPRGRLLLERFWLINAETPPRGLFDSTPPGSPLSLSPVSADAPTPECLLPGTSTSPSASVVGPTPPWVAPSSLLIGSAAPRPAILRPVSRPPLLPLGLASLRGAVALPDKSSASSIPPTISLENSWTRHPLFLLVADRAVLVRNLALLPACRLAGVRAVLALNTNNFSHFISGDQNPFSPHSIHFFLFNPLYAPCSPVRPEPRPLLLQT
jgi:hypothetical protein